MFWLRRRPRPPGTVTADRSRVLIAIEKVAIPDDLLAKLAPEGSGDWGGADYPVIELSESLCGQVAELITKAGHQG